MTLVVDFDLRKGFGQMRDQRKRPTCLAFAASDAHQYARQHPDPLCVEWLFYHAGTGPQNGTTIPAIRAILEDLGQPDEVFWPYSGCWPNHKPWKPPAEKPTLWRCNSHTCQANPASVRASVERGIPVIITFILSDTFKTPLTWVTYGTDVIIGVDEEPLTDSWDEHALVVVGSGSYCENPVLLVRNSWGLKWGNQGYAWVRESYLAPRLTGAFTISTGDNHEL